MQRTPAARSSRRLWPAARPFPWRPSIGRRMGALDMRSQRPAGPREAPGDAACQRWPQRVRSEGQVRSVLRVPRGDDTAGQSDRGPHQPRRRTCTWAGSLPSETGIESQNQQWLSIAWCANALTPVAGTATNSKRHGGCAEQAPNGRRSWFRNRGLRSDKDPCEARAPATESSRKTRSTAVEKESEDGLRGSIAGSGKLAECLPPRIR